MMLRIGLLATLLCAHHAACANLPVREIEVAGRKVLLDNRPVKLSIEVLDEFVDDPDGAALARGLHRSYREAYEAARAANARLLPSVSLVYGKCKRFDDGMYAAVELAVEEPFGKLRLGKREFLWDVLGRVAAAPARSDFGEQAARLATSRLAAAFKHAGIPVPLEADRLVAELMTDRSRKPQGFYTWSMELERIFRRDTALQARFKPDQPDEVAAAALIAHTILTAPELRAEYDALNALHARLTNRLDGPTAHELEELAGGLAELERAAHDGAAARELSGKLKESGRPGFALLLPAQARENLAVWLEGMDGFVEAVRDGSIDLAPTDDSGWYEYQQYALEPLLLPDNNPEAEKLELGDKYRELLEAAFKAIMSQVRETHIKQLAPMEAIAPAPPEVEIEPHLAVEPLATTYLRFAGAYDFLEAQLADKLGEEALDLHARDEGAVQRPAPIRRELDDLRRLLLGAQLLTCRDLGLEPWPAEKWAALGDTALDIMREAEEWLGNWHEDPDMARDVRMMIEVAREPNRYWAVIGVQLAKLRVEFVERPRVEGDVTPEFRHADYWVPVERFIEVLNLPEPLDREEFRALCDEAKTEAAIVAKLRRQGGRVTGKGHQPEHALPVPTGPGWVLLALVVLVLAALVVLRLIRGALGK